MARASTTAMRTTERVDWTIIASFAGRVRGMTSVGLKAVALGVGEVEVVEQGRLPVGRRTRRVGHLRKLEVGVLAQTQRPRLPVHPGQRPSTAA